MHCAECKRAAHFQEGTGVSLDAGAAADTSVRCLHSCSIFQPGAATDDVRVCVLYSGLR